MWPNNFPVTILSSLPRPLFFSSAVQLLTYGSLLSLNWLSHGIFSLKSREIEKRIVIVVGRCFPHTTACQIRTWRSSLLMAPTPFCYWRSRQSCWTPICITTVYDQRVKWQSTSLYTISEVRCWREGLTSWLWFSRILWSIWWDILSRERVLYLPILGMGSPRYFES